MIFHASERKAIFILIILIISVFILPQQFRADKPDFFLLPATIEGDTLRSVKDTLPIKRVQPSPAPKKQTTRSPIELNQADSATLVKVRGIGPYYAAKIIRYREQLGSFYSIKQLKDLKMKYFQIDSNPHLFSVNPALIRKIELDTSNFKSLVRHPYLEYEDVQLIFNAKRKYGRISYDTLEKHGVLTSFKLKKIKPYFK